MTIRTTIQITLPGGRSVGVPVTFHVQTEEVDRLLGGMVDRMEHLEPLTRLYADRLRKALQENFQQGGRPAWAPLAPSTLDRKRRLGFSSRILVERGDLEKSYITAGAPGHVEDRNTQTGETSVGSDYRTKKGKPLAVMHQKGAAPYTIKSPFGRGKPITHPGYPARPQTLTQEDAEDLGKITADYIAGGKA